MKYLANAFSLQMLRKPDCLISVHQLDYDEFKVLTHDAYSVIGHKDIANILGVNYNREELKLNPDDVLFIAQVWGGRLPEGTKEIPEGVELRFYCVKILDTLKK